MEPFSKLLQSTVFSKVIIEPKGKVVSHKLYSFNRTKECLIISKAIS